jgi:ankyrin repeat protein
MNILAFAILQNLNKIADFLLDKASFLRDGRTEINPIATEHEIAEHVVPKPLFVPLLVALIRKNRPITERLLSLGVSPNSFGFGLNPFSVFVVVNNPECIRKFVTEYKIDVNVKNKNEDTPLFYAIRSPYSNAALISTLISLGADIQHTTFYRGKSVGLLAIAYKMRRWKEASVLVKQGADVIEEGPGKPLEVACLAGFAKGTWEKKKVLLNLLIEGGADINNYRPPQRPIIIELVRRGLEVELQYLLQHHHLELNATDGEGETALDWALSTKHHAAGCASLLFQRGAKFPNRSSDVLILALFHGSVYVGFQVTGVHGPQVGYG